MGIGKPKKNNALLSRYMNMGKQLPWLDGIVVAYVAMVLFFQTLFQISPVVTWFTKTPLYSIQTYLGLLGGVLLFLDFFTNKVIWKGKNCLLLYGILVLAGLASLRVMDYGLKENIFKLAWAAIQFSLVYSLAHRMDRDKLIRWGILLYSGLMVIWVAACCVSLYQYVRQIGYWEMVNPLAKDASYTRQGFFDNRLFGIFYTLNHAAYISLLFILFGSFHFRRTKRIGVKVFLCVAGVVMVSHILLSGSRSALVSMLAAICAISWMKLYSLDNWIGWKKAVYPLGIVLVIGVAAAVILLGYKNSLAKVPYYYQQLTSQHAAQPTETEQTEATEETKATEEAEVNQGTETENVIQTDDDLLSRDYLESDQSNGRLSIWKDYISIYKDVGLIGLSPGNYMSYVRENHPELYIVEYIRLYYPAKYQSGFIYHVHSGYMMVYVAAGLGGLMLLAAFMLLTLIQIIRKIIREKKLSSLLVCAFTTVLVVAISAAFDESIFFQNNPQTTTFWLMLGVLMKESDLKN